MDKPYTQMTEQERDALAVAQADASLQGGGTMHTVAVREVQIIDIKNLRRRLGLTQKAFSDRFGFTLGALRHWEQGKRLPDRSTRILLHLIAEQPQTAERIARRAL